MCKYPDGSGGNRVTTLPRIDGSILISNEPVFGTPNTGFFLFESTSMACLKASACSQNWYHRITWLEFFVFLLFIIMGQCWL